MIDFHVHTARCGHATGSVAEMVAAAEAAGLDAIGLTEHLPLPDGLDPLACYAMSPGETESYVLEVARAAAHSSIEVIVAAEADWIPGRAAECAEIRRSARDAGVRVLLGSVHFLDDWAFDDPDLIDRWETQDVRSVWETYFTEWCLAAKSGFFDVMAHPDLVKKFGHVPSGDVADLYSAAAAAACEGGVAIEVSTGGLRKPVAEVYPGPDLLAAFARAGVPATTGSDAHSPAEVGYRLDLARAALLEAGYREVVLPLGCGEKRCYEL